VVILSPKQFDVPVKIHFASPEGSDVGSVFVDRVIPQREGIRFFFGKSSVAVLNDNCLLIGSRQLARVAIRQKKPFWYDFVEGDT